MLDLKRLRVLQAVGEAGSFSLAADRLDYTQPAVSKIVAALEREAGTTLVDRGLRPLRLTDAGDALARSAVAALEQLAAGAAEVDAIRRLAGGTVRVATFSSAGSGFVAAALSEFRRAHPGVAVSLAERSRPSAAIRELRAGELDLAVTFDYPSAGEIAGEGLERHHLLDDPVDVVVGRAHPLAARRRLAFADLAGEVWLLPDLGPDSPSLRLITRGCAAAGFEPRIGFRINDCHMTQALVAAGEGIALLPRLMLQPRHRGIAAIPLGAAAPIRRIVALRLPTRQLARAQQRFLELLAAAAARAWEEPRDARPARSAGPVPHGATGPSGPPG
jgi:DNA-binding transcriptional LysR family regulator